MLGDAAGVLDGNRMQAAGADLGLKCAQTLGQIEIGADHRQQFAADRGNIEGVDHHSPGEKIDDLAGNLDGDIDLGVDGGGAQMGGADHLVEAQQRIVGLRRFFGENVEGSAGHLSGLDGLGQGQFIDQTADGAVDDPAAGLDPGQGTGANDLGGFTVERDVQGDEVAAGEQFFEFDLFPPHLPDHLLAEVGIEDQNVHLQRQGALDDHATDLAGADDAKGLAGDLDPEKAIFFPAAAFGRGTGFGDLPGQGEEHGDGVFCAGGGAAEGGVHDHHPLAVGSGQVHILDSDTSPADHLEFAGGGEDLGGDLGATTNHQGVGVGHGGKQILGRDSGMIMQLEPRGFLENPQAFGRKLIGNQYLHRDDLGCWPVLECQSPGGG